MTAARFYVQHPHISGGYAVLDRQRGTLVCVFETYLSASALARALQKIVVEHIDLTWYSPEVDTLDDFQKRRLIKYLGELARYA